ncbi:MAG TPA: hypothetical protein VK826_18270 [Bacteroidia bacterium]|nr:hypothetical protein [Bacteroidia bacterium]
MKRIIFILLSVHIAFAASAQSDSVQYVQGFNFKQGVYLTYSDFLANSPLPKSSLTQEGDTSRLDFIKLALSKESFQWKDTSGKVQTTKTASVWGYSENNGVYMRWNYTFNRVVVIGTLCHFTSYTTNYMYTGPGTYPNQQYGTPVESLEQYILDTKTGTVYDFNVTTMEFVLQRDPALYAEFMALKKKKKKKEQMFIYLRKYNEKHPLYFPK